MAHEILIGVTGGVAAFKTAAAVSRLVQQGIGVTVVMTDSAKRFVGPATFRALTGRAVYCEVFEDSKFPLGPHIELARAAQLLCVAPASANYLAKAAGGIADDLLSTLTLSFTGPLLVAPAMNTEMWNKRAVKRNVQTLREDGVEILGPGSGWLSCRDQGAGRMVEPEEIVAAVLKKLEIPT
ncbi:MAG: phosphopantothenoylcysteine decarboxylase [Planctomycetales bacterium]|nr:phosphopantothenoylcysteine decarboxylase [Planctomycetales bacterium]